MAVRATKTMCPSKTCIRCRKDKPLDEFYAHSRMADGRLNKCKECCKDYAAVRRLTSDRPREIDAKRYREGKKKSNGIEWNNQNPEKKKAHVAVANAIRDGKLVRQPCRRCGAKAQAHHKDYSKPLEVDWLCSRHHIMEHNDGI